jgi:hypothetical protein
MPHTFLNSDTSEMKFGMNIMLLGVTLASNFLNPAVSKFKLETEPRHFQTGLPNVIQI